MRFGRQIGFKRRVFNTDDAMGAAPQPQNDRVAALEARLAQLANVVTTQQQALQQRDAQSQVQGQIDNAASIVRDSESRINTARTKLAQAYESADSNLIAAATAELSTATAEATAAKMNLESVKRQVAAAQQVQPQRQEKLDDSNLRNWRDRNKDWYGVDPDLTRAALEVDREVRGERILEVGSVQYFNAIDARLRAKFPEKFQSGANPSQFQVQRGAPMTNNSQQQGVRIPASVAESYRRMGLNVDDPAVVKQLVQARETAVQKGFLPATPVTDRIITR